MDPNRKTLEKQCDDLWSKRVKARDGNRCQYPGCTKYGDEMESHHIWSRRHHGSRYLPDNGITLCTADHRAAEKHPVEFRQLMEDMYLGVDRLAEITLAARRVTKWTVDQLMEIRKNLKEA